LAGRAPFMRGGNKLTEDAMEEESESPLGETGTEVDGGVVVVVS